MFVTTLGLLQFLHKSTKDHLRTREGKREEHREREGEREMEL